MTSLQFWQVLWLWRVTPSEKSVDPRWPNLVRTDWMIKKWLPGAPVDYSSKWFCHAQWHIRHSNFQVNLNRADLGVSSRVNRLHTINLIVRLFCLQYPSHTIVLASPAISAIVCTCQWVSLSPPSLSPMNEVDKINRKWSNGWTSLIYELHRISSFSLPCTSWV